MPKKIAICAFLLIFAAALANAAELSVEYDRESHKLSFSGNLTQSGKYVVVTVLPSDADRENADRFESIAVKAIKPDKDGNFSETLILPQNFKGNEYKLYASSGAVELSKSFVHINEAEASAVLELLKGKTVEEFAEIIKANHTSLGITDEKLAAYESELTDYLFAQQPENGYSAAEFGKAVNRIYGIIEARDGMDWIEMLEKYAYDFGVDIENDYEPISERAKDLVKKAVEAYDVYHISFSEEFEKSVILAEVQTAQSYGELRKTVEKHIERMTLDTSVYDKLGDYYRGYAFEQMFEQTISSYDDIASEFEAAVKKAYGKKTENENKKSGSGGSSGGKGFSSVPKITAPKPEAEPEKTDLDGHWAKNAMLELKKINVINGYPDGSYRPNDFVTRAEFIKMLAAAFGIEKSDKIFFGDTKVNDWFTPYVSGAYESKIAMGNNGAFRPNDFVTREEAAVLLARCLKESGGKASFRDDDEISDYARDAVASLAEKNILQGSEGCFMPKNRTMRGESAQMIYNALKGE